MVARDDSVIRGSMIASLIFLVLSLALNFFLWSWGNTKSTESTSAGESLRLAQTDLREKDTQLTRLKSMLGVGGFTQAEIDEMKKSTNLDPEMQQIEARFAANMSYFGQDVQDQNRNYGELPEYLVSAIRARNDQYGMAREEATKVRTDADADVANARTQENLAKQQLTEANTKLASIEQQFSEDRDRMNQEKEETQDTLNKTVQDFQSFRSSASADKNRMVVTSRTLQSTIDTQKNELNRLRSTNFESTQGEIRQVASGGTTTMINLGFADALRPNVTFGVIDSTETRIQDAKIKATIQVTKVISDHLAEARVVARPEIRNPIIPGDKVYSPFWAPGRVVKIALAGDIDINDDGRPDNDAVKGQIKAAGAVVAAEISPDGAGLDKLDASIRFLVIGEDPELTETADTASAEKEVRRIAAAGRVKAKAAELGLTVIPAWKLMNYLATVDDTLTTPLGSAVRADDFLPTENIRATRGGIPSRIAEVYKQQTEGVQQGNRILSP